MRYLLLMLLVVGCGVSTPPFPSPPHSNPSLPATPTQGTTSPSIPPIVPIVPPVGATLVGTTTCSCNEQVQSGGLWSTITLSLTARSYSDDTCTATWTNKITTTMPNNTVVTYLDGAGQWNGSFPNNGSSNSGSIGYFNLSECSPSNVYWNDGTTHSCWLSCTTQ